MFIEEFFEAGIVHFQHLLNANGDLLSYDEMASAFALSPNNSSFLKYIKMVAAIPENWLDENPNLTSTSYVSFKEKSLQKSGFLGKTNKAVYNFLRENNKILPIKQQHKWCEILQMSPDSTDWKKIYETLLLCYKRIQIKIVSNQIEFEINRD